MATQRLFIAALADTCNEALDAVVAAMDLDAKVWRTVKPQRRHLTLLFLGQGDNPQPACRQAAAAALARIAASPVDVWLDKPALLGNRRRPALVLEASQVPPGLNAMRQTLMHVLAGHCLSMESDRGFRAHVTLAYARQTQKDIPPIAASAVTLRLRELCLLCSRAGDAHYAVLARQQLISTSDL